MIIRCFFTIGVFFLISCSKYRTYEITSSGKLERVKAKIAYSKRKKGYESNLKEYFLFLKPSIKEIDTNLIIQYASSLIHKAEKNRSKHLLKNPKIAMQNDSLGNYLLNTTGFRDYDIKCDFNLRRGFIHYRASSGKF